MSAEIRSGEGQERDLFFYRERLLMESKRISLQLMMRKVKIVLPTDHQDFEIGEMARFMLKNLPMAHNMQSDEEFFTW